MDQTRGWERIGIQLEHRNKKKSKLSIHAGAHPQKSQSCGKPGESDRVLISPVAHQEYWTERPPLAQKSAIIRQAYVRMQRKEQTVAHTLMRCRTHQDLRREEISGIGRMDLRAILKEHKLATRAIPFMEQTQVLRQFRTVEQCVEEKQKRWGEAECKGNRMAAKSLIDSKDICKALL
jgi:hypothetical protein